MAAQLVTGRVAELNAIERRAVSAEEKMLPTTTSQCRNGKVGLGSESLGFIFVTLSLCHFQLSGNDLLPALTPQ